MFRSVDGRRVIFALAFVTTCAVILVCHSRGPTKVAQLLMLVSESNEDQVTSDQVTSDQVTSDQVTSDQVTSDERRQRTRQIFFIESSGRFCLTARQACAIESAAKANPRANITVYVQHSALDADRPAECAITAGVLLGHMANVRVLRRDLLGFLRDTPLWRLYTTGSFNRSTWRPFHLSDAVRVALLWKHGGLYLDLDCIVLRSLDSLNNTVGTVDYSVPNWVENGVMAFPAGHPFLHFLMKYMVLSFEPDRYMSLGPQTLTEAVGYFCDRDDDLLVDQWMMCWHRSSIFVQRSRSFYAIPGGRLDAFYQAEMDPADWDVLHGASFLSHVYGSGHGRPVPAGSLYARLAVEYCPGSFRKAIETSSHF